MARGEGWASGLGWSNFQEGAFADIGANAPNAFQDDLLQRGFEVGWFNQDVSKEYREAARDFVYEWLDTEYGIDFDEVFDWDAWREQYG